MAAKDLSKFEGMIRMLRALESNHRRAMSVRDLAELVDRSEKTVKRWADELAAVYDTGSSQPIVERTTRNSRAWVELNGHPLSIMPNLWNYAAVYLATRHLAALGEHELTASSDFVLDSLAESDTLRPEQISRIQQAFHYVPFGPKTYDDDDQTIVASLVNAAVRRLEIEAVYAPRNGEPNEKRLHPFTMVVYRDGLYVIARHGNDGPISLFAADRFIEVDVGNQRFELPDDYSPNDYFGETLGMWRGGETETVRVAMDPETARFAREREWPGCQGWCERDDGRHELELEIPVTPEVVAWLLSWGPQLEVLEPEVLRDEIAERYRNALEIYE